MIQRRFPAPTPSPQDHAGLVQAYAALRMATVDCEAFDLTQAQRQVVIRMGLERLAESVTAVSDVDQQRRYDGVEDALKIALHAVMGTSETPTPKESGMHYHASPGNNGATFVGTSPSGTGTQEQLRTQEEKFFAPLRDRITMYAHELVYGD